MIHSEYSTNVVYKDFNDVLKNTVRIDDIKVDQTSDLYKWLSDIPENTQPIPSNAE